jgi:dephospho-CoA kinase
MHTQRTGVAGFMGAGKSTFARSFTQHGFTVIDADAEAKQLMDACAIIQRDLSRAFGDAVIRQGKVDFKKLGAIAFENGENLQRLNAIVHLPLKEKLGERIKAFGAGRMIMDAALIPLWHTEDWFDTLFWIRTPASIRIARLSAKLNLDPLLIEQRMRMQEKLFPEPSKSPWKIIDNNGSLEELEKKAFNEAQLLT